MLPIDVWRYDQVNVMAVGNPSVGMGAVVPVTGFEWWLPLCLLFTVNNTGGAQDAQPRVILAWNNQTVFVASASAVVQAGSVAVSCFGVGLSESILTDGDKTAALPVMPLVGPGIVTATFNFGDASTQIQDVTLTVGGRLYRNVQR